MRPYAMTEEQRYLFDAFGYLIVPDAVSGAQIDELRSTLRMPAEQREPAGRHAGSAALVQGVA